MSLMCYEFIEGGNTAVNKNGIINTDDFVERNGITEFHQNLIQTNELIEI